MNAPVNAGPRGVFPRFQGLIHSGLRTSMVSNETAEKLGTSSNCQNSAGIIRRLTEVVKDLRLPDCEIAMWPATRVGRNDS